MLAPWKTASRTMYARLWEYDESRYPRFFYFNRYLNRVVLNKDFELFGYEKIN